ncbi:hypothetical protein PGB90_005108 [Kerria lacca]
MDRTDESHPVLARDFVNLTIVLPPLFNPAGVHTSRTVPSSLAVTVTDGTVMSISIFRSSQQIIGVCRTKIIQSRIT